jgi:hypothetical protein
MPLIGGFTLTDKEIEGYIKAHEKVPLIGENREYIIADIQPLRDYSILSNS